MRLVGRIVRATVAIGVVLALGACSSEDDDALAVDSGAPEDEVGEPESASSGPYVEAWLNAMADDEVMGLAEAEAACLVAAVVDMYGAGRLRDAGVTPQDFAAADELGAVGVQPPPGGEADLAVSIEACGGVVATVEQGMVDDFPTQFGVDLPVEAAQCMREELVDREVAEALAAAVLDPGGTGDTDNTALLRSMLWRCPGVTAAILVANLESATASESTPEGEECVARFVEENEELIRTTFTSPDQTSTSSMADILGRTCGPLFVAPAG